MVLVDSRPQESGYWGGVNSWNRMALPTVSIFSTDSASIRVSLSVTPLSRSCCPFPSVAYHIMQADHALSLWFSERNPGAYDKLLYTPLFYVVFAAGRSLFGKDRAGSRLGSHF